MIPSSQKKHIKILMQFSTIFILLGSFSHIYASDAYLSQFTISLGIDKKNSKPIQINHKIQNSADEVWATAQVSNVTGKPKLSMVWYFGEQKIKRKLKQ